MLKRVTAIVFIFFASFVLLAHLFVPHQHCEGHICVVNSFDENKGCNHHPNEADKNQDHEKNQKETNCLVSQVVILPSNHTKGVCKQLFFTDDHTDRDGFQAILFDSATRKYSPPIISTYENIVIQTQHISYITTKLGVRGSPLA